MGLQLMAGDNQGNVNSYIALVPQDLLHDTLGGFAPRRVDGHANADDIAIAHMGASLLSVKTSCLMRGSSGTTTPKGSATS